MGQTESFDSRYRPDFGINTHFSFVTAGSRRTGDALRAFADDWAELDRALVEMAASGSVEVREDGEWLAELAALHCELRREGKSALVHLWSDQRNLTRRVLRVKERSENRILLEVQRFGNAKPGRLEFLRADSPRSAGRITREEFRSRLRRILSENFPDAIIESLTAAPDLEHSFSGLYVRGRMHEGSRGWAFLAISPNESAAAIEGILAFGILWLDWTRSHADRRAIGGLRLFVPEGTSGPLRERLLALSTAARTEIYELREPDGRMQKVDSTDAGNLNSRLVARREIEGALGAAREGVTRIRALVPNASAPIETRVATGTNETVETSLCFHGLEFARWTEQGVLFGLGDLRQHLSRGTAPALARLMGDLELHRRSETEETNHPLYRSAPERWLETLILEDPTRLDAQLNPQYLYSQIPALAAGDRGVIDLLGVTLRGRLVVIELKASEDIQLPIQAVDYWLRVRRHQRENNFQRNGYFVGVELDSRPPLIWLVAPGLQFHPSTDTLLKYLAPEIQITRVGLNENWRCGLQIIFRQ
ncbi:MAG TPA: hypothetical protein VN861_15550 [Candidatus Acidoferrales bacterium]|nr:hypothetical protein [Candidatus Acidoferrales bacterium]